MRDLVEQHGAWSMTTAGLDLLPAPGSLSIGPLHLDQPLWLAALVPAIGLTLWLGRAGLSGLVGMVRRVSLLLRVALVVLLVVVIARPSWQRRAEDVATIVVFDASASVPERLRARADEALARAAEQRRGSDRVGMVTAAREPYVQSLPVSYGGALDRRHVGARDGTDLSQAVRLALGIVPDDAGARIVLLSDGNETTGSVVGAAREAAAAGIAIDAVPLRYTHEAEVVAERVIAPPTAREGQEVELQVVLSASAPTRGRLFLSANESLVPLGGESLAMPVELEEGRNIVSVTIPAGLSGTKRYVARFEPMTGPEGVPTGDALAQNNAALGVTFVSGEGRVLVVHSGPRKARPLLDALTEAGVGVRPITPELFPTQYAELAGYDAVVLIDQPAYAFSQQQQEDLKRFVADAGGGLVMVGGAESFGAGGWIGSPVAEALPVRLDPPQKRQLPKGALAIVLDRSGSMSQPVVGGGATQLELAVGAALAATDALSRRDLISVIAFDGGYETIVPLTRNEPNAIKGRIRRIGIGGGTDMFPALEAARAQLAEADAGQKHIIVLSDGQTRVSLGGVPAALQRLRESQITATTIAIGTATDDALMRNLAEGSGGRFHKVAGRGIKTELPKIFAKEAQIVRRSLIWEGEPFAPSVVASGVEAMRGIRSVPPVRGYVVTADREGLSQITMRARKDDPLAAQWQFGLGRAFAFMSDAGSKWAAGWPGWDGYQRFWEQHIRWAMRPSGSANIRILTERRAERTLVTVEAVDDEGERVRTGRFEGRLAPPDGQSVPLRLRQIGPGRWQGWAETPEPGTYVASVRYAAPSDAGAEVRGAAQAAITVPPGDELRTLTSNPAVLERVTELSGGRMLALDEAGSWELWSRQGLTMPITRRSIWLPLAFASMGLLLLDVGVRRVRIDVAGIARELRATLSPQRASAGERLDALQAARAKARERMTGSDDGVAEPAGIPAASTTFEPSADALARSSGELELEGTDLGGAPAPPAQADGREEPQPASAAAEEEAGMSRLLAAKRRARGELGED